MTTQNAVSVLSTAYPTVSFLVTEETRHFVHRNGTAPTRQTEFRIACWPKTEKPDEFYTEDGPDLETLVSKVETLLQQKP